MQTERDGWGLGRPFPAGVTPQGVNPSARAGFQAGARVLHAGVTPAQYTPPDRPHRELQP